MVHEWLETNDSTTNGSISVLSDFEQPIWIKCKYATHQICFPDVDINRIFFIGWESMNSQVLLFLINPVSFVVLSFEWVCWVVRWLLNQLAMESWIIRNYKPVGLLRLNQKGNGLIFEAALWDVQNFLKGLPVIRGFWHSLSAFWFFV